MKADLAYLGSIRIYIGLSVFIFALTAVMGYVAAGSNSELASSMLDELEMLKWIMDQPPFMIMIIIFLKNSLACAMSVLLGLGLGLLPLLIVVTNGFMLGVVSYNVIQKAGPLYLLAGILPHGIVELPVVLISIGLGFRLGYLVALSVLGEKADLVEETKIAVRLLLLKLMPLLFLAAFIETFITPQAISVVA
ncbi:MAG TPA: stage II sporulation protein M [Methanotrichaceae archaeon]|nr:stage II sporulation protein M [Methanotrichaceae archaeon]